MSIVLITAAVAVTIFLALWGAYDIGKSDGYQRGTRHKQRQAEFWKNASNGWLKRLSEVYEENNKLEQEIMALKFELNKEAK